MFHLRVDVRLRGRVIAPGGARVATRFVCLTFVPVVPLGCVAIEREARRGEPAVTRPVAWNPRSIALAYARGLGPVLVALALVLAVWLGSSRNPAVLPFVLALVAPWVLFAGVAWSLLAPGMRLPDARGLHARWHHVLALGALAVAFVETGTVFGWITVRRARHLERIAEHELHRDTHGLLGSPPRAHHHDAGVPPR